MRPEVGAGNFENHFGHRTVSGADFAAHSHPSMFRGLKPPASVRRPFGPEATFGIQSEGAASGSSRAIF